jgi:hypothetical protein
MIKLNKNQVKLRNPSQKISQTRIKIFKVTSLRKSIKILLGLQMFLHLDLIIFKINLNRIKKKKNRNKRINLTRFEMITTQITKIYQIMQLK